MNNRLKQNLIALTALTLAIYSGCNWSGGSDADFNTSRTNLEANISGFYRGALSGGKAVNGSDINSFIINQSGNTVEVQDSNGTEYRGAVGIPNTVVDAATGAVLPAGTILASYTVTWEGNNGATGRDVNFNGVVEAVAVTDIQAEQTNETVTETDASNTATADNTTRTTQDASQDASQKYFAKRIH